jgi:hypothetical protein
MKHAIIDTVEVAAVGGGAFYTLMSDVELVLKVLVSVASLGFIVYKWVKETKRK